MALPDKKIAMIAGATASLSYALSHKLAQEGWDLVLCGRNKEELHNLYSDIHVRYDTKAHIIETDFADGKFDAKKLIAAAERKADKIDALFMVAGFMGDTRWQEGPDNIERVIRVNFMSAAKLIAAMADLMSERGEGDIVVISSVSGDRGRKKNFVYGSSKAGLTAFCSGLRAKLLDSGVHLMTVKPGFIDTPGTYAMESPLVADRNKVAAIIIKAMEDKKSIIYVPWFWRYIMLIITHIPECIFKRLSI